jgi:hypothetical protein
MPGLGRLRWARARCPSRAGVSPEQLLDVRHRVPRTAYMKFFPITAEKRRTNQRGDRVMNVAIIL